jgi:hypothetical protein
MRGCLLAKAIGVKMSARFRIRTKQGQELSFASHEIFAEYVRSGDLSPDDVVYDAETREWSSALTHPVVLQMELDTQEAAEAQTAAEARHEADEGEPAPEPAEPIDLDLAPPPAGLTPEQETAAFVAKMQAERASERGLDQESPIRGLRPETSGASVVEELATPMAEPRLAPRPAPREQEWPPHRDAPLSAPASPKRASGGRSPWRYTPFVLLGIAAAVVGVYFGPELLAPATRAGDGAGSEGASQPPIPPPLIPDTEEALRARARERFLTTTQAALRGLPAVPDVWLRGSYLAEPSDYPEVPATWRQYVETIQSVRAGDVQRYREAYLRALDDARVQGGARTLRLTSAVAAFQASAAPRVAHYDRVEALATVALRGHQALVGAEGTIMYQPATGPALSSDPVIEAVGRSPQAQTLLNQVLDAILDSLQATGGPGESRNVREWVWTGLLEAVTG